MENIFCIDEQVKNRSESVKKKLDSGKAKRYDKHGNKRACMETENVEE